MTMICTSDLQIFFPEFWHWQRILLQHKASFAGEHKNLENIPFVKLFIHIDVEVDGELGPESI